MITITPEEIAQSRSALADYPDALDALQIIEDVDGNLEDAVDVILVEAAVSRTREPAEFIEQQARNLRRVICQEEFQDTFVDGFSADLLGMLVPVLMAELAISGALPAALAVAIVMYLLKGNIKRFCEGDSDADDKKKVSLKATAMWMTKTKVSLMMMAMALMEVIIAVIVLARRLTLNPRVRWW